MYKLSVKSYNVKAIVYGYVHESPQHIYLSIYINSEILILIRRMPSVHKIELHEIDECLLLFSWRTIMPLRNAESSESSDGLLFLWQKSTMRAHRLTPPHPDHHTFHVKDHRHHHQSPHHHQSHHLKKGSSKIS